MKNILITIILLLFAISSNCQSTKLVYNDSIRIDLINFLVEKGEIREWNIEKYRSKKYDFQVIGVMNSYQDTELIDGIYFFTANSSHSKVFYLIVDNNNYSILDLSHRTDLDNAIKKTMDFCERKKYCSTITEEYVERMMGAYYNINQGPASPGDRNCENGVKDAKDLP